MHDGIIVARRIAFAALDLDDAGTRIGKPRRAHWCGDRLFDGDDEEACERTCH